MFFLDLKKGPINLPIRLPRFDENLKPKILKIAKRKIIKILY